MADAIERTRWLDEVLAADGRVRSGDVEEVRRRPWGSVWKATTDAGVVFLKEPAPATAFEIDLYDLLVRTVPERVLHPVAIDAEHHRLLLPDGGPVLGEVVDRRTLLERLPTVAAQYAELQLALAPQVDALLALGVADMRPGRMLERFDEAIVDAHPSTAEEDEKIDRVAALREVFGAACRRLADAPGGASLDHNDLHGGNVFVDDVGGARFFDWGDAVVSHPFASALVLRSVVRWLQDVHEETPAERRIIDAYLEPFGSVAPRAELVEVLDLACEVGKIARSRVWARAVAPMPADADDPDDWRSAPLGWLFELLEGPLADRVQGSSDG
jgi:hypothetical protein